LGYTTSSRYALPGAGEALTPDQLEQLADKAQTRARQARVETLQAQRTRLQRELEYHQAQARNRQRQLRRIDRNLTTG
jgi:predicted RNase H-like nuclease (RuvC/YqgF family)